MGRILDMVEEFANEQSSERIKEMQKREYATSIVEAAIAQHNSKKALRHEAYRVLDEAIRGRYDLLSMPVTEAMTVSDFPVYLNNIISRMFLDQYPQYPSDWRLYTYADTSPDLRPVERYRTGAMENLLPRADLAAVQQTSVTMSRQQLQVEELGRGYSLSWRTIVNDDLGEIKRFPKELAQAAARSENQFVSNLYANATVRGNLISAGPNFSLTGPLTMRTLKQAYSAFGARTDPAGNPIMVTPKYLVVHPVNELAAKQLLTGQDVNTGNASSPDGGTVPIADTTQVTRGLLTLVLNPYCAQDEFWVFASPDDLRTVTVLRWEQKPTAFLTALAPNNMPMTATGAFGAADWTMGDFTTGELKFQVNDIIGGWNDPTYVGVTEHLGIFYGHAS